jgi:hypothetical protein
MTSAWGVLREHGWRMGPIAVSIVARAVFGLVLATVLVTRYPPETSVQFFQLFFLQSIFLTFVAGAGYAHAVAVSDRTEDAVRLTRAYLAFVVITVALVIVAENAVPRRLIAQAVSPDRWKIYLLLLGGVATGLHGLLQGVVVKSIGSLRTFMPTTAASLLGAAFLAADPGLSADGVIVCCVVYQVLNLVFLVVSSPFAWRRLKEAADPRGQGVHLVSSWTVFAIGSINTAYLLIFYIFRSFWSDHVAATVSQAAFFGLRISETYMQILALGVAQANPFRLRASDRPRRFLLTGGAAILLVALAAGLISITLTAGVAVSLLVRCVVAQIFCDLLRIPSSLTTIAQLQAGSALRYGVVTLAPMAIAAVVAAYIPATASLWNIFLFQILAAALQIGVFCVLNLTVTRSRVAAA